MAAMSTTHRGEAVDFADINHKVTGGPYKGFVGKIVSKDAAANEVNLRLIGNKRGAVLKRAEIKTFAADEVRELDSGDMLGFVNQTGEDDKALEAHEAGSWGCPKCGKSNGNDSSICNAFKNYCGGEVKLVERVDGEEKEVEAWKCLKCGFEEDDNSSTCKVEIICGGKPECKKQLTWTGTKLTSWAKDTSWNCPDCLVSNPNSVTACLACTYEAAMATSSLKHGTSKATQPFAPKPAESTTAVPSSELGLNAEAVPSLVHSTSAAAQPFASKPAASTELAPSGNIGSNGFSFPISAKPAAKDHPLKDSPGQLTSFFGNGGEAKIARSSARNMLEDTFERTSTPNELLQTISTWEGIIEAANYRSSSLYQFHADYEYEGLSGDEAKEKRKKKRLNLRESFNIHVLGPWFLDKFEELGHAKAALKAGRSTRR